MASVAAKPWREVAAGSMYTLTIDQRGSSRSHDRVGEMLRMLATAPDVTPLLAPERTVGDELQLVAADPDTVLAVVEVTSRSGGWTVGIGVGTVDEPLPPSTRAARGEAMAAARTAVQRAKRAPARIAVVAPRDPYAAERAEAALGLLLAIERRRTVRGWEVVGAVREAGSQAAAAGRLGVSTQAVSQALRAAGWAEAERGRALAAWLLARLDRP